MINFAPNVYVLQYLEASHQLGAQQETVDRATEFMMAGNRHNHDTVVYSLTVERIATSFLSVALKTAPLVTNTVPPSGLE